MTTSASKLHSKLHSSETLDFLAKCQDMMDFETAQNAENAENARNGDELQVWSKDQILSLVVQWLTLCWDVNSKDADLVSSSEICVAGEALCCIFSSIKVQEWPFDIDTAELLGTHGDRILLHGKNPAAFSWQQLADTISAVQIEFASLMSLHDTGFTCAVDLTVFLILIMRCMGYYSMHEVQIDPSDGHEFFEHIGISDETAADASGKTRAIVNDTAFCHQLYALHAIFRAMYVLTSATLAPVNVDLQVQGHHREASLDDFYELSMLSDLAPGYVAQYKFRFAHLFHSTSQVIYYHYPQYHRKIQIPMADLQTQNCCISNLLPLLRQVEPGVAVFYEHTGAGIKRVYSQHEWSWLCFSGLLVLMHQSGASYCAHDARSLLALIKQDTPPSIPVSAALD